MKGGGRGTEKDKYANTLKVYPSLYDTFLMACLYYLHSKQLISLIKIFPMENTIPNYGWNNIDKHQWF